MKGNMREHVSQNDLITTFARATRPALGEFEQNIESLSQKNYIKHTIEIYKLSQKYIRD